MYKRIIWLLFFISIHFCNAQTAKVDFSQKPPNIDSLLPKIAAEKNDSARYYLAMSALTISETNPVEDMHNYEIILLHGQKTMTWYVNCWDIHVCAMIISPLEIRLRA